MFKRAHYDRYSDILNIKQNQLISRQTRQTMMWTPSFAHILAPSPGTGPLLCQD